MINARMAITIKMPTHTPALKIPAIAWQLLKNMIQDKNSDKINLFIVIYLL